MTFIKYTNDGKAVIQPAALILSGLENEDALEMQTLDNVLVLHKEKMPPVEKMKTVISLMRLVNSLTSDTMCGFAEHIDEECAAEEDDESNEMKEHALAQFLFQAAVSLNAAVDLLKRGDPDA